ncbi:MFS transporter [Naumannella sp. ID2617S]|uniref:Putative tartrate transporter n=1 Tax=Enemella dayhoffiae TaxID=2016507 RepID=A0A255GU24_9ACTN|nr:MFS transporter [Enemella dayhoffiae]NNG18281.1 MFS transporter [Naumannella sp. ID2617S]OYO18083.1 MFS transporter [Enemella dayhoffiae]
MSSSVPPAEVRADGDSPELHATIQKVAKRLVPFLILLYFINYLDRTNIAFAGPNGMNRDLGLSQTQFGLASGLFFIGYLILEVPSNIALHKFGARRWIARIMVSWGIIATIFAFVPNATWLYVLRFLLGIAEAGFFPGIILYLTYWFPQKDRARYTALFMTAIPISTALGAPLSSWIIEITHGSIFGMAGWRAMFLVEGIPAVIIGIICWFYLTDRPSAAKWLQPSEQEVLQAKLDYEHEHKDSTYQISMGRALAMPRVWALSLVYFGGVYGLYALSFFLPTIIKGFEGQYNTKYSLVERGLINAIPFALGTISMLLWSRHSDKTGERVMHNAVPLIIGGVAIPITLYMGNPFMAMVMVSICAVGIMAFLPTFWTLPTAFLSGAAAATGIALINSIGNLAGFAAPYITGWLADLTGNQKAGLWVVGASMVIAAIITLILKAAPPPKDPDPSQLREAKPGHEAHGH